MAKRFGLSETEIIHMALSRFAKEELPAYEADSGALTSGDIKSLKKLAEEALPKGKILKKKSLF